MKRYFDITTMDLVVSITTKIKYLSVNPERINRSDSCQFERVLLSYVFMGETNLYAKLIHSELRNLYVNHQQVQKGAVNNSSTSHYTRRHLSLD